MIDVERYEAAYIDLRAWKLRHHDALSDEQNWEAIEQVERRLRRTIADGLAERHFAEQRDRPKLDPRDQGRPDRDLGGG